MKPLLLVIVVCAAFFGALVGYNHWWDSVFREGYESGVVHQADYVRCSGWTRFPSKQWRDEAWRHVQNDFSDCAIVEVYRRQVHEDPFTAGPWKDGVKQP